MKKFLILISVLLALFSARSFGQECHVVGTWNLEHFREGASRGFPERSGQIPARTSEDVENIAIAIRDWMEARVLTLQEINGTGGDNPTSDEMDDLISKLGDSFDYRIAKSGSNQRVAFLWNKDFVRLNAIHEIEIPEELSEEKDIFDRDPLVANFSFLDNGEAKNDFTFVGLHLASGQHLAENHDDAMERLLDELEALEGASDAFPTGENDILIGGDLNASRYDGPQEQFFIDFNDAEWRVLSHDVKGYPATRVNSSQIDYLIASRNTSSRKGLIKDEIEDDEAIVWQGLAWNGRFKFRDVYSDHFPVTTCIIVQEDTD